MWVMFGYVQYGTVQWTQYADGTNVVQHSTVPLSSTFTFVVIAATRTGGFLDLYKLCSTAAGQAGRVPLVTCDSTIVQYGRVQYNYRYEVVLGLDNGRIHFRIFSAPKQR